MGILLMFVFGLRNAEACAITFGNIMEINGRYYLSSHSSVNAKSAKAEIGGKTYNMYRILPIPDVGFCFLMKRKAYIKSLIDDGEIRLGVDGGVEDINHMPIACSDKDFTMHCVSADLTAEGRRILRRAEYDYSKYTEIKETARNSDDPLVFGDEKCPTAYLFRRNFGEHLRDLGYTDAEIQYLMGHVIESESRKRHDYTNSDMLERLAKKMENRPLGKEVPQAAEREASDEIVILSQNDFELIGELPCDGKTYFICLESEEYHDQIDVMIQPPPHSKTLDATKIAHWSTPRILSRAEREAEIRDVNVLRDYLKGNKTS